MNNNLRDAPRIVTWADLQTSCGPLVEGYEWGVDALLELWKNATPTPETIQSHLAGIPVAERRILLPSQFKAWWNDVAARKGYPDGVIDKVLR